MSFQRIYNKMCVGFGGLWRIHSPQRGKLLLQLWRLLIGSVFHHEESAGSWRRLGVDITRRYRQYRAKGLARAQLKSSQLAFLSAEEVGGGRLSYSQAGEDVIVDFIFRALGQERPTYLDIGAHHPSRLSNTYFFYRNGGRGVNVEPDPDLFVEFPLRRPNDINLNVGIRAGKSDIASLPFYVMSTRTLNTFSSEEAARYEATGMHLVETVIDVPVVSVNEVIERNFAGLAPDFLSIDVEGLDLEIIRSLDLQRFRPTVICVETLTFSETREERKIPEIGEYLLLHGYFLYADTYINSIFVDRAKWQASA